MGSIWAITASRPPRQQTWLLSPLVSLLFMVTGSAHGRELRIAVLSDSLTAGFDLPVAAAFPAKLQERLRQQGRNVTVINASLSGDTSGAGLARLDWAVPTDVDGVIVQLGSNDALRGIEPAATQHNLAQIVERLQQRGTAVLLAGMQAPRNLDDSYVAAFDAIYARLAGQYSVLLYPFFLDGVILDPSKLLADGMHPNEVGVALIIDRMLPSVEQWLDSLAQGRPE